jgi:hypothetical protein
MAEASGKGKKPSPQVVTAAVIEKDGLVLIGKRKRGRCFAGTGSFPGAPSRREKRRKNA